MAGRRAASQSRSKFTLSGAPLPTGVLVSLVLYGMIMKQTGRDILGLGRRFRDSSARRAVWKRNSKAQCWMIKEYWLDTMQLVLGNDFDLVQTTNPDEATRRAAKEKFDLI